MNTDEVSGFEFERSVCIRVHLWLRIKRDLAHNGKTGSETSEIQKRRGFNGLVDTCESIEIQRNWLKRAGDPTYGVFDFINHTTTSVGNAGNAAKSSNR